MSEERRQTTTARLRRLIKDILSLRQRLAAAENAISNLAEAQTRLLASAKQQTRALDHAKRRSEKLVRDLEAKMRFIVAINNGEQVNSRFQQLGYSEPQFFINKNELSIYSQNGEDGALLAIFKVIGSPYRTFIEISPGNGIECNCANLAINFHWSGLMIDSDERNMATARAFYEAMLRTSAKNVTLQAATVSAENINELILMGGFSGEVDLLSIDVDGNDFWLWQAVKVVSPRVVVCEFNRSLGDSALTIPYDPHFRRGTNGPKQYYGASLRALCHLGQKLGYSLVGRERSGVNAFFVRKDLLKEPLREADPDLVLQDPMYRFTINQTAPALFQDLPWIEIGPEGEPRPLSASQLAHQTDQT